MIEDQDVFMHNYGQLSEMLSEYLGAMSAVNQLSLQYLDQNKLVLAEIVNSSYYAYASMNSLIKALAAAGSEQAKECIVSGKELTDEVERAWDQLKIKFSGSVPNLNHPLLSLNFVVGENDE